MKINYPLKLGIDSTRRFYRVKEIRSDGFVVFDFAIGEPDLSVELILPRSAFEAFSNQAGTEEISKQDSEKAKQRQYKYLYG
ncbi:phenol hydroxylase subunit [Ampullimonas aquatilis]|uniref:phenol hydroxylase subunit n=1 Tax=Ampullimonas aquatilis TaxID=1341549 RepID=UPI003C77D7E8